MLATGTFAGPIQPAFRNIFLGFLWAGVVVSFAFLVFRVYVRLKVFKKLFVDDTFLVAAWLMQIGNATVWQLVVDQMYMVIAVQDNQTTAPPPDFNSQLTTYLRGTLTAYILSYSALWSIKIAFMVFFRRMGDMVHRQALVWRVILGIILACYVVCVSISNNKCLVGSAMEILDHCQTKQAVDREYLALKVATALDILTDMLILSFPLNILWKVKISRKKKLALAGICSLTVFVIAFAIARIAISTQNESIAAAMPRLVYWGSIEVTIAMIVACLASFRTLYVSATERTVHTHGPPVYSRSDSTQFGGGKGIALASIEIRRGTGRSSVNQVTDTRMSNKSLASSAEGILAPVNSYARTEGDVGQRDPDLDPLEGP
ncbi:hypothetical protein MMC25_001285 [Agyrium rufum]|nr:hypothetical protein [Agyrium rufum]